MCRVTDPKTGKEQSACVSCKTACFDIDAEQTYWSELRKPGRRLVQYGYLGMVIAFYLYYFLYTGNWDYYFTGAWTREADQVTKAFDPGFYVYGQVIPIPKFAAVYITFGVLIAITFTIGVVLEKGCRRLVRRYGRPILAEQAQHLAFTIFTLASFWIFFSYGARPSLNRLPTYPLLAFNALIVLVGSVWFYRTIRWSREDYEREQMAATLRRQLHKLDLDPALLEGRSLEELTPNELCTLVKVMQGFSQRLRLQTYMGVVVDLLKQKTINPTSSFEFCRNLRQELQLKDMDHFTALEAIASTHPDLLATTLSRANAYEDLTTLATTLVKPLKSRPRKA